MARKNSGTPAAGGMRLPHMGAQLTVGPASRHYRSVMTDDGGIRSTVTPSQFADGDADDGDADDGDADDGDTYEGAEMSADDGDIGEGDDGDVGDAGDAGDESMDAMSGDAGIDDDAE